ncbi:putative ABC transport system ATP-binding protein/lipoprotein-releasing system ATP-binding protein [Sediminihabitans luteus]|uniref:Putative ABC transport system ATP-binding protein/lipoprotein-releasing system ATP-binding protein n=1 Tax=Sediminihabitans luteus TaxID=1138585 RepID=A0A2M9CEQ1_9CELL|nr:ABC transporter ATP-binding protein [Sediminihabitans luteus]PJJ70358.1 putative ABC transport system ATP-binding protein/lipoprotein-releasing system ATP-binding protein [Sediminihabitans luteus]GII97830.1 macrolide ABC transporter ATP-binding protein [Sediminihabitans luteus]
MIQVRSLGVVRGDVTVLAETSFEVPDGTVTALVGPSGSGKSTLVRCLAGLAAPTTGTVLVDGVDVARLGAAAQAAFRRDMLGLVFQDPELLDELTAAENVALPRLVAGAPRRTALEAARAALAVVGCEHLAGLRPGTFSRGEAQRVALARALATPGRSVVADEPTASLDRTNGRLVVDLLVRHAREHGAATLVATHDPEVVERCDAVVDLRAGAAVVG